jgi:uncharacterized protein with PQ loop repeat
MALIYVSSRIPQLHKTWSTREAEDLNFNMFVCTLLGNLTQFLSLVLRPSQAWTIKYFSNTAPWTLNALLCALQDVILCALIYRFKNYRGRTSSAIQRVGPAGNPTEKKPLLKNASLYGSCTKNVSPSSFKPCAMNDPAFVKYPHAKRP